MPSTMPTSESRLLKEYMVDGGGLVPCFTLIQERELWEIIGTGVGIDFTVGLFVSGDNLVNHIQGKAVNSEEEDHEGPGDHFIFGLEKRLSDARNPSNIVDTIDWRLRSREFQVRSAEPF